MFLNYWLAMRTGEEVVSHDLFPTFKRYLADGQKSAEAVLADLARFAAVFESFEIEPETTTLGTFLYRVRTMDVTTAYPALLWLYGPEGIDDPEQRRRATEAIESWLVRRLVTRASTKSYSTVFLGLINAVRTEPGQPRAVAQDVIDHLAGLRGESQEWPSDTAVMSALQSMSLYTALVRSRTRMLLEALEAASNTGFSEQVILPHDLTVEHVLPQEWSTNWPLPEAGDDMSAQVRRDTLKHMLGNLTLVTKRLNPKLSNGPWAEKRAALREYSVLRISADIRQAEVWDETAIIERGARLAALATRRSGLDQPPPPASRSSNQTSEPSSTPAWTPLPASSHCPTRRTSRASSRWLTTTGWVPRCAVS